MTVTVSRAAARARRRRFGVAVGLIAVVLVSLLGPASPAEAKKVYPSSGDIADAKSKAARTRVAVAKLADAIVAADAAQQRLELKAEQAAEAYNAAQAKLEQARFNSVAAQRSAASAARDLAAARVELGQFAASSYRSGGDLANVGALLSADGPATLMDRASTINVLSTQREYVLQRVESARVVAEVLSQQAKTALVGVQAATDAVAKAQASAQAAVDDQARQVKALNIQKTTLRAQLARLDSSAAALVEQRAAGLRAEAARKAAAAAKAAALARAAAGGGSGGGGGGVISAPPGVSISTAAQGEKAVKFARSKIGTWYLWGGTGPRYDCSGLTMRGWESAGIAIPRVAAWQYAAIGKIPVSQLRAGDLVFYATDLTDYQTIHHVGMYIGNGQMIEAPHTGAQVRISSIWRGDLIGAGRP